MSSMINKHFINVFQTFTSQQKNLDGGKVDPSKEPQIEKQGSINKAEVKESGRHLKVKKACHYTIFS